jgi:hypothetical protein
VYSVEVTNANGCRGSDQIVVGKSSQPLLNLASPRTGCGAVRVDAGSAPVSYLWSTGDTTRVVDFFASGTYFISAKDEFGCLAFDTVVVNVVSDFLVDFYRPEEAFVGADVTLVDGTFPITNNVKWTLSDGRTSTQKSPTFRFNTPGIYTITLEATAGPCQGSRSKDILIVPLVSVDPKLTGTVSLEVYPNPTTGLVYISADFAIPTNGSIEVIDLAGKLLLRQQFSAGTTMKEQVSLASLSNGTYVVRVKTPEGTAQFRVIRAD